MKHLRYAWVCSSVIIFSVTIINSSVAQSVRQMMDASDLAMAEGAYIEALTTLSKVLDSDGKNSKAYNLRGVCYEKLEQFENAAASYQQAIKWDKSYAAPYFNLGIIYMSTGKEQEAIHLFDQYIQLEPTNAAGWTQKGITYLYMEQLDSALFFLNRAIDTDSLADRAYLYRGYCLSLALNYERAINDLKTAISINPSATNHFVLADLQMEVGDIEGAISSYTEALNKDSLLTAARLSRANAFLLTNDYDNCLTDTEKILDSEPQNDKAIHYQCWAYFYNGDYEKALATANAGKKVIGTKQNFDHLIGRAYLKMQHFTLAEQAFRSAIQMEPMRTDNYQLLAASILFNNTEMENLRREGNKYSFKAIHSDNLNQLNDWVKDPENKYYFPKLQQKYESDFRSLSYDEYFMYYFGFTEQEEYAPYASSTKKELQRFGDYFEKGDYDGCIQACETFLEQHPFVIEAYLFAGSAYHKLGQLDKYGEFMFKYHALLESISFTGDGKSPERAYIVGSPADEYDFLFYMGYSSDNQSLLHQNGHDYDVLRVQKNGESNFLFFNIDKPYKKLTKRFETNKISLPSDYRLNVAPEKSNQ